METEGSLPCSQDSFHYPYPEPNESRPYHPAQKKSLKHKKSNPYGHTGIVSHFIAYETHKYTLAIKTQGR
jgi:hypothetical protein